MTFEYDSVEFVIAAQDGKLTRDYFPYAKAALQIKNIVHKFMETRGIENESSTKVDVKFDLLHVKTMLYPFYDAPAENLSEYSHRVDVELTVKGEYESPKEVGWLYDCYQYWISECVLQDYSLSFKVVPNGEKVYNACFYKDSEITSEKDFF